MKTNIKRVFIGNSITVHGEVDLEGQTAVVEVKVNIRNVTDRDVTLEIEPIVITIKGS